jgi:competence protein ComEC
MIDFVLCEYNKARIGTTMPLVYLGTGWFIGIALASALHLPIEFLLPAFLVSIGGFFLWRHDRRARMIWISVLFAACGAMWFTVRLPHFDQNSLSTYNGMGTVTIEGVIDADPDVRDTYINLRVNADRLTAPDRSSRPIEGIVLVRPSRPAEFRYGDRVRVTGQLTAPPEFPTFNYADYLARQGVYSMIDRPQVKVLAQDQGNPILSAIYAFRNRAYVVIQQILPEPQASLLSGILLGIDAGLPLSVQEDFRVTGTSHIIAISGYNIVILIGIFSTITVGLVGRRRAFYVIVIALIAYAIMVGGSASVVRATIMGILLLWADHLGRPYAAPNALFASGIAMTALDPNTLFDVGFQLSFMATLGLMVYAKPFAHSTHAFLARLFNRDWARWLVDILNDALLVTLAAQVTTLPLLMYYFRQISTVALIVNPLVLPAQSGVMTFGLFALAVGLLSTPLGQLAAWTVWPFLTWTLGVIALFARVPLASIPLDYVPPLLVAGYYAGLIGLTWYFRQPREQRPNVIKKFFTPRRVIFVGGLMAILLAVALSWRTDNRLHMYVLDTDGHPVFVQTPGGKQVLIGGSNSPSSLLSALGKLLPFWDHDIDLVVVPQAGSDQLNGLTAVLDRYDVKQIMSVEVPNDNRAGRDWQALLTQKGKEPIELQSAALDSNVNLTLDGSSVLIESDSTSISIGPSERAQINLIAGKIDRLPREPQMIFTWTPVVSDTRVIDLTDRGTLDLTMTSEGVTIGEVR